MSYNPNKQGWGFATVVCIMTAGLFFTAKTIHDRTYRHPRDPMTQQVYHERDANKSEHAAPAGEHDAAMPGMDHGAAPAADHAAPAAAHDTTKPPEAKKPH